MRRCPTKKGSCWYKIFCLNGSALYTQYNYCGVTLRGIIYARKNSTCRKSYEYT